MSLTLSQGPNSGVIPSSVDAVSSGLSSANAPALNPLDRNVALRDAAVKATRDAAAEGGTSNAYAVLRRAFPNYELAGISALTIPTADARRPQGGIFDRAQGQPGGPKAESFSPESRLNKRPEGALLDPNNADQGALSREERNPEPNGVREGNGKDGSQTQVKLSSEKPSAVISLQKDQQNPLAEVTVRALKERLARFEHRSESGIASGVDGVRTEPRAVQSGHRDQRGGLNLTENGQALDLRSVEPTPELVVVHRESKGQEQGLRNAHTPEGRASLGDIAAAREVSALERTRTAVDLTFEDKGAALEVELVRFQGKPQISIA